MQMLAEKNKKTESANSFLEKELGREIAELETVLKTENPFLAVEWIRTFHKMTQQIEAAGFSNKIHPAYDYIAKQFDNAGYDSLEDKETYELWSGNDFDLDAFYADSQKTPLGMAQYIIAYAMGDTFKTARDENIYTLSDERNVYPHAMDLLLTQYDTICQPEKKATHLKRVPDFCVKCPHYKMR